MMHVNIGETVVPFDIQTGTTGQTVVVQLRKQASTTLFLDFADGVFKSAGWTTKQKSMSEVGTSAVYTTSFDSTLGSEFTSHVYAIAEYVIGGAVVGIELLDFDDKPAKAGDLMGLVTDAITAAKIATGAIDADALDASALAAIENEILDALLSGHTTAGTVGQQVSLIRKLLNNERRPKSGDPTKYELLDDDDSTSLGDYERFDKNGTNVPSTAHDVGTAVRQTRIV